MMTTRRRDAAPAGHGQVIDVDVFTPVEAHIHFYAKLSAYGHLPDDLVGAATALEELLRDVVRVYGSDHPDALAIRATLAYWRGQAGDVDGAAALRELRPARPAPGHTGSAGDDERMEIRMGFAVDIVEYGRRSAPMKEDAQRRLLGLVHDVLDDLGLGLANTQHQGTGDGINVFLPSATEVHRAFPRLIRSWRERLGLDNRRFRDRLRLRLAAAVGPTGRTAIGFAGNTVVELHRLLDSATLRQALVEHPDADLALLVSEPLYSYVIGEGYPGLDGTQFRHLQVTSKDYCAKAWLWIARHS